MSLYCLNYVNTSKFFKCIYSSDSTRNFNMVSEDVAVIGAL